jgi:acetyl-CoA carboxylase carboxyl transferase subunit alpha
VKVLLVELLGIGVGDKVLMLENTWYSVISPESCSSILWRSWEYKEQAAEALKLTAKDMKRMKLVDQIIKEPLGGAHTNREKTFVAVRDAIVSSYEELKNLSPKQLVKQRMEKYEHMGVFKD